jgi:hypothetical protein
MDEQKNDNIQQNTVRGKWNLIEDFARYEHSSAGFYELDNPGHFVVTHYKDLSSIGFAAP